MEEKQETPTNSEENLNPRIQPQVPNQVPIISSNVKQTANIIPEPTSNAGSNKVGRRLNLILIIGMCGLIASIFLALIIKIL